MPKVSASLANVSTKIEPMDPDSYAFKIEDVQDKTTDRGSEKEREAYQMVLVNDMPGTDNYGKKVWDYVSLTTKDFKPNGAGQAQLKRYFEAVFGEEEVATWGEEDYDTDRLKAGRIGAEIIIDSWEQNGKSGKSNKVKSIFPVELIET